MFGGVKLFKGLGGDLPPDVLSRSIRKSIQFCWLLQEPDKRSQEDVRRVILGALEEEMRDFEALVKGL